MTELKRYEATTQSGKPGHCFCAQVFGPDGFAIAEFNPTDDPAVSSARARLFAEACLVQEETDLTPRQLVAQQTELLDMCQRVLNVLNSVDGYDWTACDDFDDALSACRQLIEQHRGISQ